MGKRLFAILILVCMVLCLMTACGAEKKTITSAEAWNIVCEDLGSDAANAEAPHIHTATRNNQECFNIYVTVDGESLLYVVSYTGEILYKGQGSHSH